MLAQNPTKKCDQPIAYTSKFLNNEEKNYTTTERETFTMVYALHNSDSIYQETNFFSTLTTWHCCTS